MKKLFSGFYSPTDDEIKASWSNEKTLFVFDTNVLLNLYAYTKVTREDFFKIIEKVSDNIWLPYHVGLEYQRNRLNVVKNEKKIFLNIENYIKTIEDKIDNSEFKNLKLEQRLPDLFDKSEELHTKIEELLSEYRDLVKEWNKQQPDVRSSDLIRKQIDKLFDDKVGNPYKQEKLNEIFKEGKERYDNKVPPGYEDKKEKEKADKFTYQGLTYIPMYGDLIIWKQIIEKAKDDNIKSVVFVTDDIKEDWWYILNSNGKKEIGVRAELRAEIYRESKISSFEILTTTDFMKNGKEFLELEEVHEASIAEAKSNVEDRKEKSIHINWGEGKGLRNTFIHGQDIHTHLQSKAEKAMNAYIPYEQVMYDDLQKQLAKESEKATRAFVSCEQQAMYDDLQKQLAKESEKATRAFVSCEQQAMYDDLQKRLAEESEKAMNAYVPYAQAMYGDLQKRLAEESEKAMNAYVPYEQAMYDNLQKQLVGRNEYCPCGSGKKFKHCCGS